MQSDGTKAFEKLFEIADWQVITYDVWGNNREGYDVNDKHKSGRVRMHVAYSDRQVIATLKAAGVINSRCRYASFDIDGDADTIYVTYSTSRMHGYPVCELVRL